MCNKRFSVVSNLRRHLKSCVPKFDNLTAPHWPSQQQPWLPPQDLGSDDDENYPSPESSQSIISPLAKKRRLISSSSPQDSFHGKPVGPGSYAVSTLDSSIQTLSEPYFSSELAAVVVSPTSQYGLDLATSHNLPNATSLPALHLPSDNHPPDTNYLVNNRWIPRSLRKCINSSSLIPVLENSPVPPPPATSESMPSSHNPSLNRRWGEETAVDARFIRSVPPPLVFWIQIPLPPVSPGWTGTIPPPSVPSFDFIHSEYIKLMRSKNVQTDPVTQATDPSCTPTNTHPKPITGSWAGQMDAHPKMTSHNTTSSSSSSSSRSHLATAAPPSSRYDKPPSPSSTGQQANRLAYFEERDSYYDPAVLGAATAELQLAARYPYHPAAWLGRLPGPGLSQAEQSMLKMRLLEKKPA